MSIDTIISIEVKKELRFEDIVEESWCCDGFLKEIGDAGLEDDFMYLLAEVFSDEIPDMTTLNDFIRFDEDYIRESLGLPPME